MTAEPRTTAAATDLYDGFARYGSGVVLVTVADDDHDRFFIAASVLTASVDPFALAVSVGRRRDALPAILDRRPWSISMLGAEHRGLVDRLTGPTTRAQRRDALTEAGVRRSPEGPLWLPDALAAFWCVTRSSVDVDDQVLVVGDVTRGTPARPGPPLLRWNHDFHTVARAAG
ncbi:MAG: flavin reductase family protein [Gordonia sp. (in: high G+C Gram-positive bacteria)]|uniref:flavin reductase family protein n=1 Tax=Gordonia sp. (in: high G+C Gram-positive bacteria) TaxID=84139 RepID=UPI0039E2A8BA